MSDGSTITPRDRVEAATVTSRGDGHQFEIQLGHLCNNRCVFCSSGQLTALGLARPIALDPIVTAIEEARAQGARRVTFLGGEPTLHKGLPRALERAVALGFEEIVIFTNGVLLPHPGFIERIVALGRFEWRISIQGGDEASHVAVTGRPDSFARIVKGLERLRELGQRVTANICVNERSFRSLPAFPELVRRYDIRQLHVDIVRPASTGERTADYLRDIMPRYRDVAPYLGEMLERFERSASDFDVNVGNLPFCVLPQWAHRIGHGGEETVTRSCDESGLEVAVDKYEWHRSQREHPPQCASCVFRPRCTGVFKTYLALYGGDEFVPVALDALRALDSGARNFDLLVEPFLSELLAGRELPAGWRIAEVHRDARARALDVSFAAEGPVALRLRFSPPGATTAQSAAFVTNRYQMTIDVGSAGASVHRLLVWCEQTLRRAEGVDVVQPLDPAVALRAARAQRRLAALLDDLQSAAGAGVFWVDRVEALPEARGALALVRGPSGRRVEVVLEPAMRGGRSRIDVDFRLVPGTEIEAARPLVQAVIERLRGADRAWSRAELNGAP